MAEHTIHTQQLRDGERIIGLRRHPLRIEVVKGPDRKQKAEFSSDRVVIGTHERCDFVLTDPAVSRQHCEVVLVRQGYAIRDLESTNGTFLDSVRVGAVVIDRDTRIRVGDSVLRLTPLDRTVDIDVGQATHFGPLYGRSASMRQVFEILARVSPTDATVLITGESGTGKEVTARAIHENSSRAQGPFVVVDCGALPANLIESELYGHVRGSFTGATRDRVGAFEAASGGTLFLDEIGELPLDLQTRLLGALERRRVQPLGSTQLKPVDVRVVAATNRDLLSEINRGNFREDLYFRLAVVTVKMPALRERPEDIPLYVQHFLAEESALGRMGFTVDQATLDALCRQSWRGNVRELRNVLERASAMGEVQIGAAQGQAPSGLGGPATAAEQAGAGHAAPPGLAVDVSVPFKVSKNALIDEFERAYVIELMNAHQQNISRAARAADIDRVYLLRLLDKFGLRPTKRSK